MVGLPVALNFGSKTAKTHTVAQPEDLRQELL